MASINSSSQASTSEGESDSYRSMSVLAVLSLVLGLLSLLAFAPSPFFVWVFPPAAIGTGLLALRQIVGAPEVWAGKNLAKTGIALAILCGIASTCVRYAEGVRIGRSGKAVADRFLEKLKAGDIESAYWLMVPRELRKQIQGKTPAELPQTLVEQYSIFRAEAVHATEELAHGETTIEFETVEDANSEHGTETAMLVYKVRSPHEETRLLIIASADARTQSWSIRNHKFHYSPHSYVPGVSSGHGHSH